MIPDLRYLDEQGHQAFPAIVAGLYADKGMPSFAGDLSLEQVEAIHQYLIKRSGDLRRELQSAP